MFPTFSRHVDPTKVSLFKAPDQAEIKMAIQQIDLFSVLISFLQISRGRKATMSELCTLLQLLTEACATVEHEYSKTSVPKLPSLNDLEPHPLDAQLCPVELRKAVRVIEAATHQMCALVGRPDHVIVNV